MRLWVRLALAMGVLAVLPVVVVGALSIDVATDSAEQARATQLQLDAATKAERVGHWIEDQAELVLTWPGLYGDRLGTLSTAEQQGLARIAYLGTAAAVAVVLLDGRGRQVVRAVPEEAQAHVEDLLAHLPFQQAIAEPGKAHMGTAWVPAGGEPSLPFAVLAADAPAPEDQRVLGVEVSLRISDDLLAGVSDNYAVALVDPEGAPLLGTDHPLVDMSALVSLLGTATTVEYGTAAHQGRIQRVDPVGWWLVVAESTEAVQAPARQIRSRMLVALLLAAGAALWLALFVADSLSTPVERLRNAAMRVADGAYGERVQESRADEIGDLARAFDHMSERLQRDQRAIAEQQQRIEGFNQELQQQVAERTEELQAAQAELVRSGQLAAVAELGAGLAHDLNNPLTAVIGIAQILREQRPDAPMIADLEQQAQRCRDVVGTMLRVAELEVDPQDVPVVDIVVVLREVAELVTGAFRKRGVGLQVSAGEEGRLRVRVDASHCARLITQVLAGMRGGLDRGASVQVSAETSGPNVVVQFDATTPVAERPERRDDWMASGHRLWVARQLAASVGGALEDHDGGRCFRLVLPGG